MQGRGGPNYRATKGRVYKNAHQVPFGAGFHPVNDREAERKKEKKMRLLLLFFPLCLIVAAFVVPVKNAGSGVYDIVNDMHNMNRSDSAELLCRSIEQHNDLILVEVKNAQVKNSISKYKAMKDPQTIEVINALGKSQYIKKDSIQ